MRGKYLYASLAFVAATGVFATANAQDKEGFAASRFEPSERGSEWFALESLDFRGKARPAVGLVAEYQVRPLAIYSKEGGDGTLAYSVVRNLFNIHPGASIVFAERLRLSASLPVTIFQDGRPGAIQLPDGSVQSFAAPANEQSVGDLRIGLDGRILGEHNEAFRLAIGAQLWLPTGSRKDYNSDDGIRVAPRVLVAGDIGAFTYAARLNLTFRPSTSFGQGSVGSDFGFAASAGLRVLDKKLVVGPELFGSTVFGGLPDAKSLFEKRETPVELMLGAHYTATGDFRVGAGVGTGIGRGFGSPQFHALLNLEWMPGTEKAVEKPIEAGPIDTDKDGIFDDVDACKDVFGIKSDDKSKNGCPADSDGDGILDDVDACKDVVGVHTNDKATNGCPPDTDGDGILDNADACIDKPGIKTDDKATNGCPPPPDKDKDGILDADDACVDVAGIKSAKKEFNGCPVDIDADKIENDTDACPRMAGPTNKDPKKNGCPNAGLDADGTIFILDQVQFATGSAVIKAGKPNDDILAAVVKVVKENNLKGLSIEGHTDNKGNAAANKTLSQGRANAVMARLIKDGKFDKGMFRAEGFGQEKPRDSNDTDAGRQNNRRVEFHVLKEAPVAAAPAAPAATPRPAATPAAPKPATPAAPAAPKPATPAAPAAPKPAVPPKK